MDAISSASNSRMRSARPLVSGGRPARPTNAATTRLLSLKDASAELGISAWTLRDLIGSGQLKAVQPPGVRRIYLDRKDVDAAIERWKS